MFDVGRLRTIVRESAETAAFSFVGVRRNPSDGVLELWLPQGFGEFPIGNYSETTRIFFALYRALKKFAAKGTLQQDRAGQARDPLGEREDEGAAHRAQLIAEQLTFSRVARLERVMNEYTEALMRSLVTRSFPRPPKSLESIHRSLHTALFSEDHSFFLPETREPTLGLGEIRTDLIELAAYIYREILTWTYGPSTVPVHIAHAAGVFREAHLPASSGLFSEGSFDEVLRVLRRELQLVFRRAVYRDQDFWNVFEAVEAFLYGDLNESDQIGDEWGISDFHPVWEDMCHSYMTELTDFRGDIVLFADGPQRKNKFEDNGPFVLRWGKRSRRLAPDFVLRMQVDAERAKKERIDIRITTANHGFVEVTVRQLEENENVYLEIRKIFQKNLSGGKVTELSHTSFRPSKQIPSVVWNKIEAKINQVFETTERKNNSKSFILDFKYMPVSDFSREHMTSKAREDIIKSLAYEYALSNRSEVVGTKLANQFIVPAYFAGTNSDHDFLMAGKPEFQAANKSFAPHEILIASGIVLIQLNFLRALRSYAPPSDVDV